MPLTSYEIGTDEAWLSDHAALASRLFTHPGVTAQLLQEFFLDISLAELDLSTIEPVMVDLNLGTKESFQSVLISRIVRHDGGDLYSLLLFAMRSTSDKYVALHVFNYVMRLLYWEVMQKQCSHDGKVPAVLPIVLYTGEECWTAPRQLGQLFAQSPLSPMQPEQRYYVVDARRYTDEELRDRAGLPALWFRLLAAADREQIAVVTKAAAVWFASHPAFLAAEPIFADILAMMSATRETPVRAGNP